jgi:hypothetical protein
MLHSPSAIAVATNFGVDDVQSRLAGEIFQVLYIEIKPCPNPVVRWEARENKARGGPETVRWPQQGTGEIQ